MQLSHGWHNPLTANNVKAIGKLKNAFYAQTVNFSLQSAVCCLNFNL